MRSQLDLSNSMPSNGSKLRKVTYRDVTDNTVSNAPQNLNTYR